MDVCSCTYMFSLCIYHVHTWHVQFHFAMNKKIKQGNLMQRSSFEPTIEGITASCLNHYTTNMLVSYTIVTVYVYCFSTWLGRLVTRRRTSRTPLAAMTLQARASTWISLKPRSAAKQALPETAFGPKQPSARARRQVDLEVREFRSSESDWHA